MLPFILMTIPIYIIVRMVVIKIKNKKINWYFEIGLSLLIFFLVGLLSQALVSNNRTHQTNLIPFIVLKDTYREVFKNGNINYFLINFMGNIIMFMPIGFMLPLLYKISVKKVILLGSLFSLFIEISQLFLQRGTDIDDLMLNTLGVVLGLVIYKLVDKKKKELVNKFKVM